MSNARVEAQGKGPLSSHHGACSLGPPGLPHCGHAVYRSPSHHSSCVDLELRFNPFDYIRRCIYLGKEQPEPGENKFILVSSTRLCELVSPKERSLFRKVTFFSYGFAHSNFKIHVIPRPSFCPFWVFLQRGGVTLCVVYVFLSCTQLDREHSVRFEWKS